ncbi:MAG: hypothetical protein RMJ43_02280 [Chloroherpetonaceae bacterium]|nr:hypothetical protein [Chthonomonadaceae bacterium]MDW8206636.1 hypothetical protein [Chloroherpetonaceae bacterium]
MAATHGQRLEPEAEAPMALVVDNDLFFTVRIEKTLTAMGYRVCVAMDRTAALAKVSAATPALALIAFGKSELDPVALVQQLKALPAPPQVLGYIAHVRLPAVREEARQAGCDLLVPHSAVHTRLPFLIERLQAHDIAAAQQIADEAE